jgi:hypothetical protein
MNFNSMDLTPKYFKQDFSPGGFRPMMPFMKSPMAQVGCFSCFQGKLIMYSRREMMVQSPIQNYLSTIT